MNAIRITLAMLLATVGWASLSVGQDDAKKKDEALERLLEKIENTKPPDDKPRDSQDKADAKLADEKKAEAGKKSGEVEDKDKALDSLLEKIGEKEADAPKTKKEPKLPGAPSSKPSQPKTGGLDEKEQKLDEHLEEFLRKKKKKDDGQQGQGQGQGQDEDNSPLGEAIKKMRDVEQRLGKTDTGEQTRKKQGEIVQDLETILKQIRQQAQSGKGKGMRTAKQAGMPNGNQPGGDNQAANNPTGVGPMRPKTPTSAHSLLGDKSAWGNLPPELRTDLENIFKEEMLPNREELIKRYFLSVSKGKSRAHEE